MNIRAVFNSSTRSIPTILGLAALMALIPLRKTFAQNNLLIGQSYSVKAMTEVVFGKEGHKPVFAYERLRLSTASQPGKPIYVNTEYLVTATPDGNYGYVLEGDGAALRSSNNYKVDKKLAMVLFFNNITTSPRLPKLDISNIAKGKRLESANELFRLGHRLEFITKCVNENGIFSEYNEYYANDKDGGRMAIMKIQGDKVVLTQMAEKFIRLPAANSLEIKP